MESIFEIGNIENGFNDLTHAIQNDTQIKLHANAIELIEKGRKYLDQKLQNSNDAFYGINTGFGSLCDTVVSKDELSQLQENLLLSHACGTGAFVPHKLVKIMLLLKVQGLSFGLSGVQLQTVERLIDFYNNDILPVVYEQGSLGASGDLAPLAHLCLPLIGKGKVWVKENGNFVIKEAVEVLKEKGWEPIKLQAKEGLALINGTQFMNAYAMHLIIEVANLSAWANVIACASIDAFNCRLEPFIDLVHKARGHHGQIMVANNIRKILQDSQLALSPKTSVQDPYAFRCIPQVHGASRDVVGFVKMTVMTEFEAVTDNPLIFPDEDKIISGGNFHGQPLALALDFLAIAMAEWGSISERRTYQLISGQRGLPPFLTANPGLNSGFMIPQYTAASIVSQNKQLCTPAVVDSIVSSNGQEDHVSMGANAATKALRVLDNVFTILGIEWMCATQALEFRMPTKSSSLITELMEDYRTKVPKLEADRLLHDDIIASVDFIRNRRLPAN
jgi:histidine ammonia-lyase